MTCDHCHTHFSTSRSGFVVCPHCGYVNVAATLQNIEKPVVHWAKPWMRMLRKHLLLAAGVLLLMCLGVGGLQNMVANQHVNQAVALSRAGKYIKAAQILGPTPGILVLPSIRERAKAQTADNNTWLTYAGYQAAATQLMQEGKYAQALVLLQKVANDYPTYSTVAKLTTTATAALQQSTPSPPATDTVAAVSPPVTVPAPAVTPTPVPKTTSTPSQPAPTTSPKTTPTPPPPSGLFSGAYCKLDYTQALDLYATAKRIFDTCEAAMPKIETMLGASLWARPYPFIMKDADYPGVTYGDHVEVDKEWMRGHPDDMALVAHESAHVVQSYRTYAPGWIVEGMAVYVSNKLGYDVPHCKSGQSYTDGYECGAALLTYIEEQYPAATVKKLHTTIRANNYSDQFFVANTGKNLGQLWSACLSSYCSGSL